MHIYGVKLLLFGVRPQPNNCWMGIKENISNLCDEALHTFSPLISFHLGLCLNTEILFNKWIKGSRFPAAFCGIFCSHNLMTREHRTSEDSIGQSWSKSNSIEDLIDSGNTLIQSSSSSLSHLNHTESHLNRHKKVYIFFPLVLFRMWAESSDNSQLHEHNWLAACTKAI